MGTKVLGSQAGGLVSVEVDYSDVLLRPTALRVINNSGLLPEGDSARGAACYARLTQLRDGGTAPAGRMYGARFAAGTTEIAIPVTIALRLQFRLDAAGRLDDIGFELLFPYP